MDENESDRTRNQSRKEPCWQTDERTPEAMLEIYGSEFPWMSGNELLDLALLFDKCDINKNGYIELDELTKLLQLVVRELFDYVSQQSVFQLFLF